MRINGTGQGFSRLARPVVGALIPKRNILSRIRLAGAHALNQRRPIGHVDGVGPAAGTNAAALNFPRVFHAWGAPRPERRVADLLLTCAPVSFV